MQSLGANPLLVCREPIRALVLPTIILRLARLLFARYVCPQCLPRPVSSLPNTFSHAGAPPSATVLSATALVFCVSVVPRAGVAVLVALMFRRTKARPACFMWSHVWAQNP